MKLWIDDIRPAPEGYKLALGVSHAIIIIEKAEEIIANARYAITDYEENYKYDTSVDKDCKEHYERYMIPALEQQIIENTIELIDCDHDLGKYAKFGGDGIKLLDWLEETGRDYPIRIHSANPVGVANMRRIIQRNNWKEVF